MSPTSHTPGEDEFSDTDQRWLDRLLSKTPDHSPPQGEPELEADALRRALQLEKEAAASDPEIDAAVSPAERQRRWEQLQFRLRREGVADNGAADKRPAWRSRWLPLSAAIAAGVLAFAVLRPDFDDGGRYDPPPIIRGAVNSAEVADAHPRRAAEARVEAMRAAGLQPRLYRDGKVYVIDVDVTAETAPAALEAVRHAGLEPRVGLNRISVGPAPE